MHLLCVDESTLLKLNLKIYKATVWKGLNCFRIWSVSGCCNCGNERMSSIKGCKTSKLLYGYQLFKMHYSLKN